MMTDALRGVSEEAALQLMSSVVMMLTGSEDASEIGKLKVLAGVREFPTRIQCASLAWHAMKAAVAHETDAPVSTE